MTDMPGLCCDHQHPQEDFELQLLSIPGADDVLSLIITIA